MKILITGATGLVGKSISELCQKRGIQFHYLTTRKNKIKDSENCRGFYWNPTKGEIDITCFERVDTIINLAGSSIFKKWNKKNKTEILNSRVQSLQLLYDSLKSTSNNVNHIISASAIGIYLHSYKKIYTEEDNNVSDTFLGSVIDEWESAADKFSELNVKVTKLRTGMVLDRKEGAFPKLKNAAKNYMAASFGAGNQWQSWIHIYDLSRLYLFVAEKELTGIYNAVAPNPVTNQTLNKKLAKELEKQSIINKIPEFAVKLIFGERSILLLESQLVSSKKIEENGFRFKYKKVRKAIKDLI
ncbi:MAG TPA: TIGR01777 family oxidoreductase [Salinimicrobium sp.]|nr:TIGR01777 family oxidoreductase [Salinimicrobium sp.]